MSEQQKPVPIVALPPTKKGPEYISTTTSIGFMGRLCLTTGVNYLLGIGFGGIIGAYKGLRNSPSPRFRIRLNSFLNGAAQAGSHSGNALAVFTMYYLSSYHVIQRINFKYHILGDKSLAFCAGMTTGFLYKLTAGILFIYFC